MEYIIHKAVCSYADNSKLVIKYDAANPSESNTCSNIGVFKAKLKAKLDTPSVHVQSILLTYEERDNRKRKNS